MSPTLVPRRESPVRAARLRLAALLAAALLPFALHQQASAQEAGTVRGTIVEAGTQRPMSGVQVSIVGTQRGGLTDANGVYLILNVPVGPRTVRVDMIGYRSLEQAVTVTAGGTASADFTISPSAVGLDEIVVTGTAGQTTKRALGNTVSKINAAAVTDAAPINTVQELLQGRTPGLTLLSNAGQAGASSKIRIRGASSITAGNEPVVFVDGVRITSGTQSGYSTSNGVVQGTSALDAINPRDIESIEVIKGPAAATLYGAEAAGGVIQIITKKGRGTEGIQWNASFEAGQSDWNLDRPVTYWLCTPSNIASPNTFPGCAGMDPNSPAAQRLLKDEPLNPGARSPAVVRRVQEMCQANAAAGLIPDANCAQDLQNFTCLYTDPCSPTPLRVGDVWGVNLSARGGGDNYSFYISGEKADEQGVFFNNFSRRIAGRANLGFVPSPVLNFNVNVGYTDSDVMMPLNNNSSNSILRNSFRGRAGASNDQWYPGYRGFSPELSNQWDNRIAAERMTLGITTNYNPTSWLQNRLTVGYDRNDRINTLFYRIDETGQAPWGTPENTGQISEFMPLNRVWTVDYSGTASTQLSENYSSALSAGMQLIKRRSDSHETIGEGLVANNLNLVSAAAVTRAGQGFSEQTSLGFYVQEQLGFKDRLYATAAVRVDDNSAFGEDFSLVVYPKASLAWVLSEEDFFDVGFIDELKLRGAWGQAGNAPAPFSADRTLEPAVTIVGDVAVNQLEFDSFGNPDLKAETGQEIELGFDASTFDGRLGAEFTYYYQQTKDALLGVPAPRSSGFGGTRLVNVGEIRNSGVELLLTAGLVQTPTVAWDALLSIGTNSNEMVSFGRDAEGNPILDELTFGAFASVQRHREGYPLGGFWAVDVLRDESGRPVLDSSGDVTVLNSCPWPTGGRILEGDDRPTLQDECQEVYVGPMLPTREISLTNTITLFNNLRLYANVDYKGGHYQWCAICSINSRIDQNTLAINDPRQETDADVAAEIAALKSLQTRTHIDNADFIKLREVSATINIPTRFTQRFGFDRASLTLAGRNLWMWTAYDLGADPEVSFYSQSDFTQLDYSSAPQMRRWLATVNVSF